MDYNFSFAEKSLPRFMRSPLSNQTPPVSVKEAIVNQCHTRFTAVRENCDSTWSIIHPLPPAVSQYNLLIIVNLMEQLDGVAVVEMS